jgi:hypothetical protein
MTGHPAIDTTDFPVCDVRVPPEVVSRILDRLDAAQPSPEASQRRSERYSLRGLAVLVLIGADGVTEAIIRVRLRNVSRHGVAFLSARPILPGTAFRIGLPIGPAGETVERAATAVRCRLVGHGLHEVGAEFSSVLPKRVAPDTR